MKTKFIYQREYFNPSTFGKEKTKVIEAGSVDEACQKMLDYMNQFANIGCKPFVYLNGEEISIEHVGFIQHMFIHD